MRKTTILTRLSLMGICLLFSLLFYHFFVAGSVLAQEPPPRPALNEPLPDSNERNGGGDHNNDKSIGAYIELQVQPAQAGIWTMVQWQDSAGVWQKVEGWQGTLETNDSKRWWVAPRDLGKGPFRWELYQSQEGEWLGSSEPFDLPDKADEVVRIEMTLGP